MEQMYIKIVRLSMYAKKNLPFNEGEVYPVTYVPLDYPHNVKFHNTKFNTFYTANPYDIGIIVRFNRNTSFKNTNQNAEYDSASLTGYSGLVFRCDEYGTPHTREYLRKANNEFKENKRRLEKEKEEQKRAARLHL